MDAPLSAEEQAERDALIEAEIRASGQRAAALADDLELEIHHGPILR